MCHGKVIFLTCSGISLTYQMKISFQRHPETSKPIRRKIRSKSKSNKLWIRAKTHNTYDLYIEATETTSRNGYRKLKKVHTTIWLKRNLKTLINWQLNNAEKYRQPLDNLTKLSKDAIIETIKRFEKEHWIKDKVADGFIT